MQVTGVPPALRVAGFDSPRHRRAGPDLLQLVVLEQRIVFVTTVHAVFSNPLMSLGSPPCCSRYGLGGAHETMRVAGGGGGAFATSATTSTRATYLGYD